MNGRMLARLLRLRQLQHDAAKVALANANEARRATEEERLRRAEMLHSLHLPDRADAATWLAMAASRQSAALAVSDSAELVRLAVADGRGRGAGLVPGPGRRAGPRADRGTAARGRGARPPGPRAARAGRPFGDPRGRGGRGPRTGGGPMSIDVVESRIAALQSQLAALASGTPPPVSGDRGVHGVVLLRRAERPER